MTWAHSSGPALGWAGCRAAYTGHVPRLRGVQSRLNRPLDYGACTCQRKWALRVERVWAVYYSLEHAVPKMQSSRQFPLTVMFHLWHVINPFTDFKMPDLIMGTGTGRYNFPSCPRVSISSSWGAVTKRSSFLPSRPKMRDPRSGLLDAFQLHTHY